MQNVMPNSLLFARVNYLDVRSDEHRMKMPLAGWLTNEGFGIFRSLGQEWYETILELVGELEMRRLQSKEQLIAYVGDPFFPDETYEERKTIAIRVREYLDVLLNVLWLQRDHCAFITAIHFVSVVDPNDSFVVQVGGGATLCDGAPGIATSFTWDEMRDAFTRLVQLFPSVEKTDETKRLANMDLVANQTSRVGRAIHFIKAARSNLILSVKIANYMTALEALLKPNERPKRKDADKVLVRAQALFDRCGADGKSVIKKINEARKFRNKAIHGGFDERDFDESLRKTVVEFDSFLRQSIQACLDDERVMPCVTKIPTEESEAELTALLEP